MNNSTEITQALEAKGIHPSTLFWIPLSFSETDDLKEDQKLPLKITDAISK